MGQDTVSFSKSDRDEKEARSQALDEQQQP
jgi:hypothetical protein